MATLIAVPYHLGARADSVGAGPLRLLESDPGQKLPADVTVLDVGVNASMEQVNDAIAGAVTQVRAAGRFPVVVAGNCSSCLGTLAALTDLQPGIVWFDLHLDIDVLDPGISSGTNCRSLGRAKLEALLNAIGFVMNRYRVAAFAITNYNPAKDRENRTRDIIVEILEFVLPLRRTIAYR
jgi:arginase family enzyme